MIKILNNKLLKVFKDDKPITINETNEEIFDNWFYCKRCESWGDDWSCPCYYR